MFSGGMNILIVVNFSLKMMSVLGILSHIHCGPRIDKIGTLLRKNRCLSNRDLLKRVKKLHSESDLLHWTLTRLRAAVHRKGKKREEMVTDFVIKITPQPIQRSKFVSFGANIRLFYFSTPPLIFLPTFSVLQIQNIRERERRFDTIPEIKTNATRRWRAF